MTIQEAQQQLVFQLYHIYDNREAAAIASLVMERVTEWKKIDRVINKNLPLSLAKIELLQKYTDELLLHKPVQYVLHEAWFAGMKFYVDENVLIPRPETEELVDWAAKEFEIANGPRPMAEAEFPFSVLDIGTGSGCIPIALKKKLPFTQIYSCDISEGAINVAKKNAIDNNASIQFLHLDFLNIEETKLLPSFDMIISNPPYIPIKDKETMMPNVTEYEPHLALFVDNENTLIFYKAIIEFAKTQLVAGGKLFLEIHEDQAINVKKLFPAENFPDIEIKKDMQGKERMLKATKLL